VKATSIIYRAAGSPEIPGAITEGTCRTCGEPGIGLSWAKWVKPTFTDHDKICGGEIVCAACLFCFDDQRTDLAERMGKDKHQKMRNYSHFVAGGEWLPLSKGDKARMRDLLLAGPEVAVIAVSGQKHLAFRCLPGWWQIEDATVQPFARELTELLPVVEEIYNAGISKTEIETGRYIQRRILDCGVEWWAARERVIAPLRGSIQLQLALFLAQRKDDDEDGTPADSRPAAVADLEGNCRRLQDEVRKVDLEPVRRQPTQRSLYEFID
jgi:hypothetical protein